MTKYDGLNDEDPSMEGTKFTKFTTDGNKIEVTEEEANKSVEISNNVISIDENLSGKAFARTTAHEFGHAAFTLLNKAKAFFLPKTTALGHEKGNPNGKAALDAVEQFENNYKNAKKELEKEKNDQEKNDQEKNGH